MSGNSSEGRDEIYCKLRVLEEPILDRLLLKPVSFDPPDVPIGEKLPYIRFRRSVVIDIAHSLLWGHW